MNSQHPNSYLYLSDFPVAKDTVVYHESHGETLLCPSECQSNTHSGTAIID